MTYSGGSSSFEIADADMHVKLFDMFEAECKRLLADGLSVSETAHLVGYADPAYFSRVFRRCVGTPPRAVGALAAKRPATCRVSTRSATGPTRG